MNATLDFYVCLSNPVRDALVADFSNDYAPARPEFVLRDTPVVRIRFCTRDAATAQLVMADPGAAVAINFGGKRADQVVSSSTLLFAATAFVRDATDPEDVFWSAPLNLNTTEFINAFASTTPIDLITEIELVEDDERRTVSQAQSLGLYDVVRGGEGGATPSVPPLPTAPTANALLGGNPAGTAWSFTAHSFLLFVRNDITAYTGGAATALDAIPTASGATLLNQWLGLLVGGSLSIWRLEVWDGVTAENAAAGLVLADDAHPVTNPRIWVRIL